MPLAATPRRLRPAICLVLLLLPFVAWSEVRPGAGSADGDTAKVPGLDQAAVHAFYLEGEFDSVLARIHGFRKENPDHSRGDSLFIARHLAVVLAANPNSVEAGKYWMHHLLILSPQAGLEGMYVSEAIEDVFRRVKREAKNRSGGGGSRKWLWIGAAGTALAAGAAAWLLLDSEPDRTERTSVPVTL
jgi:hypothetical protein